MTTTERRTLRFAHAPDATVAVFDGEPGGVLPTLDALAPNGVALVIRPYAEPGAEGPVTDGHVQFAHELAAAARHYADQLDAYRAGLDNTQT